MWPERWLRSTWLEERLLKWYLKTLQLQITLEVKCLKNVRIVALSCFKFCWKLRTDVLKTHLCANSLQLSGVLRHIWVGVRGVMRGREQLTSTRVTGSGNYNTPPTRYLQLSILCADRKRSGERVDKGEFFFQFSQTPAKLRGRVLI